VISSLRTRDALDSTFAFFRTRQDRQPQAPFTAATTATATTASSLRSYLTIPIGKMDKNAKSNAGEKQSDIESANGFFTAGGSTKATSTASVTFKLDGDSAKEDYNMHNTDALRQFNAIARSRRSLDQWDVLDEHRDVKTFHRVGSTPDLPSLPSGVLPVPTTNPNFASDGLVKPLGWSGKFCGGLMADVKRRAPYYIKDWTDAFLPENRSRVVSSIFFLFFACLAPAITFGTLFSEFTEDHLGPIETILATAISGVVYAIFSGQPLCILGATGPEYAYTIVFYNFCKAFNLEFLPARIWQGLWTALFTALVVVFDLSALMGYVTRFSEEIFTGLISFMFVIQALVSVAMVYTEPEKGREVAYATTLLCFGTFATVMSFRAIKRSTQLNQLVRDILGNYGTTIAILIFSGIAKAFPTKVDMLSIPDKFEPSYHEPATGKTRSWLVNPMGTYNDFPMWGIFFTMLPALGLTFLGFMDQQLTAMFINRKDHNLQKPPAYHLDLFVFVGLYPLLAFLGLPFTHASTVPSITHMVSLTNYETVPLAGGGAMTRAKSVIEQRVSHLGIHLLIALSLVLGPALRLIPRAVLFGIFLYMGVTSVGGNQLFDRLQLLLIWNPKHFPQYDYVKSVPWRRMHMFTVFQFSMLLVLFALTQIGAVAVIFPFFIGFLVLLRKFWMPHVISAEDLNALDM